MTLVDGCCKVKAFVFFSFPIKRNYYSRRFVKHTPDIATNSVGQSSAKCSILCSSSRNSFRKANVRMQGVRLGSLSEMTTFPLVNGAIKTHTSIYNTCILESAATTKRLECAESKWLLEMFMRNVNNVLIAMRKPSQQNTWSLRAGHIIVRTYRTPDIDLRHFFAQFTSLCTAHWLHSLSRFRRCCTRTPSIRPRSL